MSSWETNLSTKDFASWTSWWPGTSWGHWDTTPAAPEGEKSQSSSQIKETWLLLWLQARRWAGEQHHRAQSQPSLKKQGRGGRCAMPNAVPWFNTSVLKWDYSKICVPKMHLLLLFTSIKTLHRIFNPGNLWGLYPWLFFLLPSWPKGANKGLSAALW